MKIIVTDLTIQFDPDSYTGNSKERALKALENAKEVLREVGIELKHCENLNWRVDKKG
jgi:transcriptional regulator of met regulon